MKTDKIQVKWAARSPWTRPSVLGRPEGVGEEPMFLFFGSDGGSWRSRETHFAARGAFCVDPEVWCQVRCGEREREREKFLKAKDTRKLLNVWCKENIIDVSKVTGAKKNVRILWKSANPEIEHELMTV